MKENIATILALLLGLWLQLTMAIDLEEMHDNVQMFENDIDDIELRFPGRETTPFDQRRWTDPSWWKRPEKRKRKRCWHDRRNKRRCIVA
jgi:hypothetical protein